MEGALVEAAAVALVAEMAAVALETVVAALETNAAGHKDERRRRWWRRGGSKGLCSTKTNELFGSRTLVCLYRGGPFSTGP